MVLICSKEFDEKVKCARPTKINIHGKRVTYRTYLFDAEVFISSKKTTRVKKSFSENKSDKTASSWLAGHFQAQRHLKKIFQWSLMLDMNMVRESVPSFDQTRLVLEFSLINEENRKMSGSGSVAKKVELKADKCDIHSDDGLEQKLQDPIATGD
nr:hypothetical protein [Tanacetum cinerariifolium]